MQPNDSTVQRSSVLLSLQRAMLGEVFPALRGVSVMWDRQNIQIAAYVDGPPTMADEESVSEIETQVMADFLEPIVVESEIIRQDSSSPLPNVANGIWVFRRREP
jgi:hypothetical protein